MNKNIKFDVQGSNTSKKIEVDVVIPIYDPRSTPRIKMSTTDVIQYLKVLHSPKITGDLQVLEESYLDNVPPDYVLAGKWVFEKAPTPAKAKKVATKPRAPKTKKA